MKTIQELYDEVINSEELKKEFLEAAKAGKQEAFLKEHGCDATLEEVKAFLEAKAKEDAPLSLNELQNAAGGECNDKTRSEVVDSIFSVGIACMIKAIESARSGKHLGQQNAGEGRICNND